MDKFFNLKTAVAALSILLVAAILLGLMGYLSLRRQLGPGGTPPVTSAPGNSTPGEDSVATKGSYTLSLKDYGAKGDGKTDDTQAVKSWLAALKPGYTGYIPAGEYVFKEPLVGPQVKGVGIRGEGAQQSILVYQGDDRDCDLLTLGSDSKLTALTGWILQGFSVESDVRMIGGTALRLRWMQGGTRIMDVDISRLNKEKNLWDGVWFDCCNVATYDGFNINVRNEGVIVSGADDSDAASDVSLDHGAITFCTVGIHVGGGFGGLYVGQVLVYGVEQTGFLWDNARANRANREIILTSECVLDAGHSYGVHVNDPLSDQATFQIDAYFSGAGWIEPATPGDNIFIEKMPSGRVSIGSTQLRYPARHNLHVADSTTDILISPTCFIVGARGYGIYTTYGNGNNIVFDGKFEYNARGNQNY